MLQITLAEMGHPQPATPIQTDNSNATGIANGTVYQRKSKAMDMRFYWVQDRVRQKHFIVYWRPGSQNLAAYFTKHFPAAHHQQIRPQYLHVDANTIVIAPSLIAQTIAQVTVRVCSSSSGLHRSIGPGPSTCAVPWQHVAPRGDTWRHLQASSNHTTHFPHNIT